MQTPRPGRKGSFMSRVAIALALLFSPTVVRADDAKKDTNAELVKTAQAVFKDLKTVTLENGLRVYLLPVKGAPTVSVMVAYKVGSADEEKDQTGLSHYLEHLMFKGTEKLKPGDIDRMTQRNGGANNAYTTEDMTVYHFDFAADRWQSALDIEADRMRNIRIDAKHEFEQEKGAVVSELNGNEDRPGDLEYKAVLALLWPKESPYSHPVIGQREHVLGATAEIIKRHYDKWYHPNNAALVIAGGFNADETLAKIKTMFGSIPKGDLPKRKVPTYFKERAGPVHKEFESKFDQPRMVMGFNTVAVGTPEDPILDVIQYILADGKTSRLYRKLVEDERIASSVDAGNYAGRYPGWFSVSLDLLKGKDRKKAEEMVFAELEKLATEPISDEELNRARKKLLARFVFSRESVHSLADAISRTSTYPGGDDVARFFAEYLDRVLKLTKADVQRVAKEYLARKQACVVWSVPPEPKGGGRKEEGGKQEPKRAASSSSAFRLPPSALKEAAGAGGFSLTDAKRVVLPNGMVVILLEDHKLPVVVGAVEVADVSLREQAEKNGIAELVGSLLEEGTAKHTGKQISTLIEDTGGSLSIGSTGGSFKVLTPDTDLALGLLFECLEHPSFPAEAFARQKEQQIAGIEDAATQPHSRASDAFHALVYGKHPFSRPHSGTLATVEKLTVEDCKAFHKLAFAPNFTTVVLVGDFKTADMLKKIEALTKDWKKSDLGKPVVEAPPKITTVVESIISDPTAAQVHVFIGQLGITRDNPDYYKLLVMDNVLGTGPGFTDRMSSTLRDRQGLAYTVRATIASGAGKQPGTFTGYVGTFPDKFLDVKHGFLREFNRIRDEAPTKEEVEDAKKYLLGSLPFRFTTMSSVAGQLLAAEKYGLGFDFIEKYKKEVAAVTPEDVQAVAKKYLDPKTLTIVVVGAIDKEGKPLRKK
ncbi:MAG: insulinase family protein [Planctomycetes bacterium]|nr:insulinase family protein [Planctomycetota bacterium]